MTRSPIKLSWTAKKNQDICHLQSSGFQKNTPPLTCCCQVVIKLLQKIQLVIFRMSLIFKRIRSLVKQSIALLCSFLPQRVWSKLYLSSVLQVQFEGGTQHVGGWEWRLFSRLLAPTIMSKWPHIRHSAASLSSTWENLHHLLFPRRAWLSMLGKCRR